MKNLNKTIYEEGGYGTEYFRRYGKGELPPEPEPEPIPDTSLDAYECDFSEYVSLYEGDVITDQNYAAAAICKAGDVTYLFVAPTDSYAKSTHSNNGYVYAVQNNAVIPGFPKVVPISHCNGATYDAKNRRILVTPIWTYTGSEREGWPVVLEFDLNMNLVATHNTSVNLMSIAYNYEDEKVYGFRGWNNDVVYEYTDSEVKVVSTIQREDKNAPQLDQGFAVKGHFGYASNSSNVIIVFNIETGEVIAQHAVSKKDFMGVYQLDELEDFDFDEKGNLWAARYCALDSWHTDQFATTIVYDEFTHNAGYQGYGLKNSSFYITDESVATFRNSFTTLKHPSQLNYVQFNYPGNPLQLRVNCNKDFGNFTLYVPAIFEITKMVTGRIGSFNKLYIYPAAPESIIRCSNLPNRQLILLERLADLSLSGYEAGGNNYRLYIENAPEEGVIVRIDSYMPYIKIRSNVFVNGIGTGANGNLFKIGDANMPNDIRGFYVGSTRVWSPNGGGGGGEVTPQDVIDIITTHPDVIINLIVNNAETIFSNPRVINAIKLYVKTAPLGTSVTARTNYLLKEATNYEFKEGVEDSDE